MNSLENLMQIQYVLSNNHLSSFSMLDLLHLCQSILATITDMILAQRSIPGQGSASPNTAFRVTVGLTFANSPDLKIHSVAKGNILVGRGYSAHGW